MMRKLNLFLLAVSCLLIIRAGSHAEEPATAVKVINGVTHVYNPVQPLKGEVTLNLERSLTLDPAKMEDDDVEDLYFDDFERDENGNIYLIDGTHIAIYKFSPAGKYLLSFLREGEGPGEMKFRPHVQALGKDIWVINAQKFARYDLNGGFLKEFQFEDYLYSVTIIDENRFIAEYEKYHDDGKSITKYIGLFSLNDKKNILNFFDALNVGSYFVQLGKQSMSITPPVGIIPDIIKAFDFTTGRVYLSLNRDYELSALNLKGNIELVIHKESDNPVLTEKDKEDIVNRFGKMPEDWKKKVIAGLPDKQCAIRSIETLSNGHILVKQVVGYKKDALDVFSKDGKYLYRIKLPATFNLKDIKFYKGILSGIEEREDTNVYHEYKINSLPEVF